MNYEQKKKRNKIRVVITEIFMVISVIALTALLIFIVSGYSVNSDFEVERQGLLQISSTPSGADVLIDGTSSWFQRTNTSKMLSSGEHTVEVTREGYDKWTKTVYINDGLLYRIHYPRLFAIDREKENALDISTLTGFSLSPKRDFLMAKNTNDEWVKINLKDNTLKPEVLTIDNATNIFKDWEKHNKEKNEDEHDENGNILLKFYEDKYTILFYGDKITVNNINNNENKVVFEGTIGFIPEKISIGHGGEFLVMSLGNNIVTLDMESMSLKKWNIENSIFGWLDDDMIYTISTEGKLIVYDYDGYNRRELANNVIPNTLVTVVNDKWLYYFSNNFIVRELITR